MDITICIGCGASSEGIVTVCPSCGDKRLSYNAALKPGEMVYTCGNCRKIRRLTFEENPELNQKQYGHIQKGTTLQIPLTLWNTIFKCEECHNWNWVTLDDRISGFEMPCPDCGVQSVLETLGRHLVLSKQMLKPIVLGELRQAGKPITLKCGHHLYLPTVLIEGPQRTEPDPGAPETAPTEAPVPSVPPSEKKKTQPIPFVPPKD